MPEIASQQFAMLRMFFMVARRCDNSRSEGSWASGPEATQDRAGGLVCVLVGRENASVTSCRSGRTSRDPPF